MHGQQNINKGTFHVSPVFVNVDTLASTLILGST